MEQEVGGVGGSGGVKCWIRKGNSWINRVKEGPCKNDRLASTRSITNGKRDVRKIISQRQQRRDNWVKYSRFSASGRKAIGIGDARP